MRFRAALTVHLCQHLYLLLAAPVIVALSSMHLIGWHDAPHVIEKIP